LKALQKTAKFRRNDQTRAGIPIQERWAHLKKILYREVSLKPMHFSSSGNNRERRRCTCTCVYVHIWRERAAYVCRSGIIWSEVAEVDEPRSVLTTLGQWAWQRRCQGWRTARIQQTVLSFKVFP
jgi:hypothetical protein